MIKDYFSTAEIAEILDIDEISAWEMRMGMLELEIDELMELASYRGISVEQLFPLPVEKWKPERSKENKRP